MAEKSVREMNELERRHYSLQGRVFRMTVLGSSILGIVAFLIGIGLYGYALTSQYIGESFGLAKSVSVIVSQWGDADVLAQDIMTVYDGMSETERQQVGTEAYAARFREFTERENYVQLLELLREFKNSSDIYDLYLGTYDAKTGALVYFVDPDEDPETVCYPGEWEEVPARELNKFLNWDGNGKLYDIGNTEDYGFLCTAGVPVKDADGKILYYVLGDVSLGNVAHGLWSFFWQYTIALAITVILYSILLDRHLKKTLVQPINAIAEAATAYIQEKNKGEGGSDRFASLNIRTGDEIENLSLVMADMEKDIIRYIENLTSVTAEKERIGAELNVATRIQANILPNTFPAFPERDEFDIYATMDPAKEVGGDFYDFFMTDENHLVLVIADVSDKGVPAALFMMTARTMLKDAMLTGLDPASALYRVNARLSENNKDYMFVTVWLGVLDIRSGKLTWADAGHERPCLYHDGKWTFVEKHDAVPVAAFEPELLELEPDPVYINEEIQLAHGDMIFQYTDGVTEAMTADREQFGMERVLQALSAAPDLEPEALLPYVRAEIDAFTAGAPQFDDITMLALRFL